MEHFSEANEYSILTFNGKDFHFKFYQGFLFATEELADEIYDESTGLAVSEAAEKLDNNISFYFDEDDFYSKSGKELYEETIKI